jgi:hypothetical protein
LEDGVVERLKRDARAKAGIFVMLLIRMEGNGRKWKMELLKDTSEMLAPMEGTPTRVKTKIN